MNLTPDCKEIHDRYLRESHTWERQFKKINTSINDFPGYNRGRYTHIVSAIHVPEEIVHFSIRIFSRGHELRSYIDWFDEECPLGSILIESKRLPGNITESGYRRIVPYHPFIYLPSNSYMKIDLDGLLSYDYYCYVEYYVLENLGGSAYPQVLMNLEPNLVFGDTFCPYWEDGDLICDILDLLDNTDHSYKINEKFSSRLPNTDYELGSGIP